MSEQISSPVIVTNITVNGMTCGHCVAAVSAEVSKLAGVASVEVDLATGGVTVRADRLVDAAELAAAVDEAGYEVSSR